MLLKFNMPFNCRSHFCSLLIPLCDLLLQPQEILLNMGMSSDYREAVSVGADVVRIGTALFGPRE